MIRVPLYRNYNEFSVTVVQTILDMIKKSRGSLVTFNAKKIAVLANIETQPVVLTLVKDVLEKLRERGYLEVLGKTKHGVKYAVRRDTPLWVLAKNYDKVVLRSLDDLNLILEKMAVAT
ncbi:MAG: hypothetical protein LM573_02520 [Thermofilum sp.]|uniref:DNA-binding protein n=1 Tax=Thermofilum adornatum TaxID=1365176 RepID=A0A7C1CCF1_9CREN|nr:hypothetical protein [Thermofilum sp.]MCC5997929.1 hypothetical protein [Thermofilum sp.]NAZ25045.1 hypothetical protein [Thermofilum sp.]